MKNSNGKKGKEGNISCQEMLLPIDIGGHI